MKLFGGGPRSHDEVGPRRHEREAHRHLLIEIANEHRRFAARSRVTMPSGETFVARFVRLVNREPGDIALRAIGKPCDGPQLHSVFRLDEHALRRRSPRAWSALPGRS